MILKEALSIADGIVGALSPNCEKIHIAGSCRREKANVKDIEIICDPKKKVIFDVFGEELKKVRVKAFIETVGSLGKIIKGTPINGKWIQIQLPQQVKLDLFMPDSNDYYRQYATRTGSADYSHFILSIGCNRLGWCGSDMGLRKIADCTKNKRGEWICLNQNAELPPVWASEQEFFEWAQIKWVEPRLRSLSLDK